mmetsp:Transcript_2320/g.3499  ORF Transcript_2320/g.3499 Transcript_2320/m.3499 type:complete len:266 (+) Transcript_2320:1177-1974(+)
MALWHQDPRQRDGADKFDRVQLGHIRQWRIRHWNQHVDRHRIRVFLQCGQRQQHVDPVHLLLAHAYDAAGADLHARLAHPVQGVDTIGKGAGGDDLRVVALGGVDIMVVVVQPGIAQAKHLAVVQHAQRHAGLHTQLLDPVDHRLKRSHVAILWRAPGGPHAIACGTARLGPACLCQNPLHLDQFCRRELGTVTGGLRTIGAVLGTAAGLDAEQFGFLHLIGIIVQPVHRLRLKQQIHKWLVVNCFGFGAGPVGSNGGGVQHSVS